MFEKKALLLQPKTGKCCTASSLRILQGLTAAKVVGCSSAIQRACPPRLFSSVGQSTWFVISGSLVRIRQEAQRRILKISWFSGFFRSCGGDGLLRDSRKSADPKSVGIVIRLSNKNHLHRLSCKRLLKLVQAGLHREQKGIERLQDGLASCTKGSWTFAWRFCTCAKRPWS